MELKKVESSNIEAIGWADGVLGVKFKSGAIYKGPATREEYDAFAKADSLGSHFARVFRARMTKVEDEEGDAA